MIIDIHAGEATCLLAQPEPTCDNSPMMKATDIARQRRRRQRAVGRAGPRILQGLGLVIVLVLLAIVLVVVVTVAGSAAGLLVLLGDMPDIALLADLPERYTASPATTRLYAGRVPDGEETDFRLLIDEITDPRQGSAGWQPLAEIPTEVIAATLAAEDPYFLAAPPADPIAELARGLEIGHFERPVSPLIQRLIDTELEYRPDRLRKPVRSVGDRLLAWQIESRYGRERVLEWRLNTRYYGQLAYGTEAAAQVYFDKPVAELNLGEAALLAAIGLDPAANPFDDPAAARAGQAAVLEAMAAGGFISYETRAATTYPALSAPPGADSATPHFARLARRQLERLLGPERLVRGGLEVETMLDPALQQQVACTLESYLAGVEQPPGSGGGPPCSAARLLPGPDESLPLGGTLHGAVVVLDPATGAIQALWASDSNDAYRLPARLTGTLARPFIYLTALSQGYTAATSLMDIPTTFLLDGQAYTPENGDGLFRGPLRLREAAAGNISVPATQVLSWVGAELVLQNVQALGIDMNDDQPAGDLALAEEGFSATVLDLTHAFAALANNGTSAGVVLPGGFEPEAIPRPATIRRVVAADGQVLYTLEPAHRETLAPELAYLMTDILAGDTISSNGQRAAVAAGESPATGDAWTIGYTPDRVLGVWLGGDHGIKGMEIAAPVWQALAEWTTAGQPILNWAKPAGLVESEICDLSGLRPRRGIDCGAIPEWFIAGTEPFEIDTMVQEVALNRENGRRATIFTPPDLIEWKVYTVYPDEAAQWAAGQGIPAPPEEYDTPRRIPTRVGDAAELFVEPWSLVSGQLSVAGSAGGEGFAYYRLAYFPGLLPEAMQTIFGPFESPVEAAELGIWDTTLVEDGLYTLLLTVVREDDTFSEIAIPVTIANNTQ
jgi:membrane carboxypeptidase/penicillin-binding protein